MLFLKRNIVKINLFIFLTLFVNIAYSQKDSDLPSEIKYALIEASRLKVLGNVEEALKVYKSCVNSYPECGAAWYEIGTLYLSAGLNNQAEENLKKSFDLDRHNYWYSYSYADVLAINEKYEESNKIMKRMLKDFPKEKIFIIYKIADNFYNQKNYSKSLKYFNKIEKDLGISEMISVRKLEIFKKIGQDRKIEKEFNYIFRINPGNIPLNIIYAEYLVENNKIDEAIKKYEYILDIDEDNIYAISNLSELYLEKGDKEKANQFLIKTFKSEEISPVKKIQMLSVLIKDEKLLKNESKHIEEIISFLGLTESNNFEFLLVLYDFYVKTNKFEESFEVIKKMTELRKDDYVIWAHSLYNGIQVEKYEDVIKLGTEALSIFPNKDDLRVFIAIGYFNLNDFESAYKILKEAGNNYTEVELKNQSKILLAEIAYKMGNIKESFQQFDNLLNEFPENKILKNNYSYYMALEKINLQKAKELSYETIVEEPENSTYLDTYAWILYQKEEYVEAEKFIRMAVSYSIERNKEILLHMVEILLKNGKNSEAELIKTELNKNK